MKSSKKKQVTFEIQIGEHCEVYVAGSFNGWDPKVHKLDSVNGDGLYRAKLPLPKGRHEYKFVVNEQWVIDPSAAETVPNGMGDYNSVMTVS